MTVLRLHILPAALVYVNTLMIQDVLAEPGWEHVLGPADYRGLTPLIWAPAAMHGGVQAQHEQPTHPRRHPGRDPDQRPVPIADRSVVRRVRVGTGTNPTSANTDASDVGRVAVESGKFERIRFHERFCVSNGGGLLHFHAYHWIGALLGHRRGGRSRAIRQRCSLHSDVDLDATDQRFHAGFCAKNMRTVRRRAVTLPRISNSN